MAEEQETTKGKLALAIRHYKEIEASPKRQDSEEFQRELYNTIQEFKVLESIISSLCLFSDNESFNEINTSYLPFSTVPYYLASLSQKALVSVRTAFHFDPDAKLLRKPENLQYAKIKLVAFLHQLDQFKQILTPEQSQMLNSYSNSFNPSPEEIMASTGNPTEKRATKIANYRLERELEGKLETLDRYYEKYGTNSDDLDEDNPFVRCDEDEIRSVYIDQLKLFSIKAFGSLELAAMELQVLSNMPEDHERRSKADERQNVVDSTDPLGYTPRLEGTHRPKKVSDLINKQGKILQPFVITNTRADLKKKVFGTGQMLPTMSVEEYLDYELANGKMMKSEEPGANDGSEDEDDSDEELRKREWDDWKDDNPKGSGNMGANMG